MQVALMFQKWDVDAFLSEIDHEQFEEWATFLQLQPQGWTAMQIVAGRIAFIQAQVHTKRRLKERQFVPQAAGAVIRTAAGERAKWEAQSISSQIMAKLRERKKARQAKNTAESPKPAKKQQQKGRKRG